MGELNVSTSECIQYITHKNVNVEIIYLNMHFELNVSA